MKFAKVIFIIVVLIALATTATAQKGTQWLRVSTGETESAYGQSDVYLTFSMNLFERTGFSYIIKFKHKFYLDVNYESILSDRLGFQASIAYMQYQVRFSKYFNSGALNPEYDLEADAGTSFMLPITAGINIHPFKVHKFDLFAGAVGGLIFRGPINYPVGDEQNTQLEKTDLGVGLLGGWNCGVSMLISTIRVTAMFRQLYAFDKISLDHPDSWYKEIPAEGRGIELGLGLAFEL